MRQRYLSPHLAEVLVVWAIVLLAIAVPVLVLLAKNLGS
jgi:hypothetical protein